MFGSNDIIEYVDRIEILNPKDLSLQVENITNSKEYGYTMITEYIGTIATITGELVDGRKFKAQVNLTNKDGIARLEFHLEKEDPHWIDLSSETYMYKCSECGGTSCNTTLYCPHCGVKMIIK